MYADTQSDAMKDAIKETARRREIQEEYNKNNNIIPHTIVKDIPESVSIHKAREEEIIKDKDETELTKEETLEMIKQLEEEMKEFAKNLNFEMAAEIRDTIIELKKKV